MFNSLKKLFSNSSEFKGKLCTQDKITDNSILTILPDALTFDKNTKILFSEISDLEESNSSISFVVDKIKYKFESKESKNIYESIRPLISDKFIYSCNNAIYYLYNNQSKRFEKAGEKLKVKIIFDQVYYLRVENDTSIIHYEVIKTTTQYYMDQQNKGFVWSIFFENQFHTFCIEFVENLDFLEFSSKYIECIFKSVNESGEFKFYENMATIKKSDVGFSKEPIEDESLEDWNSFESDDHQDSEFNTEKNINEHLIVSDSHVFVTRGSSLGVFDVSKGHLEFKTHVKDALEDPEKILTRNQENNLLILNKEKTNELSLMDLNRGEVVEKWNINENMNDFFNSERTNNNGSLVGVSDYSIFKIDPRSKEKVVQKKEYKTKNEFSAGITNDRGDVAIASKKGDLRLYNNIEKRAKSLLPGFGDEIIGIDASKDGSRVLCTCKHYILLFNVNSDYSVLVGKDKPTPIRLQLKPQHLSIVNEEVSFTAAKFDKDDSMIVTSTGRYVVKWRLKDVLEGDLYKYSLKALYDVIVDENFVVNGDDIVIALPNDVKKVTEKELRHPK